MIPQNKSELLDEIDTSFTKLFLKIEEISVDTCNIKKIPWHKKDTYISPKDLIAYLLWWWELVIKWLHCDKEKKKIHFPEKGFQWNQLWELAEKFYTDYENFELGTLKQELQKNKEEIKKYILENSNTDLYETIWYKKYTRWRMIQLNTISPYKNATARIQKYLKTL